MKESVGYTVTLNMVIVFIIIIFVLLSGVLIYFKSNKISNRITDALEKYEGYNKKAQDEISEKMLSLGYNKNKITCKKEIKVSILGSKTCSLAENGDNGKQGYCVYLCEEDDYYYYKIRTNMMINIPIINNILNIPIYANTNRMYDFEKKLKS